MHHPPARRHRLSLLAALVLAAAAVTPADATTRPIDERPSPTPLLGYVIALDPGHNGGNASHPELISHMVWVGNMWNHCNRTGTATKAGYPEHRFDWLVSNLVKTRLEALGARVVMTRQRDDGVGPCVDVRSRLGGNVSAALEVSIHADGADSDFRGFSIMKPTRAAAFSTAIADRSTILARAMRDGMASVGLPIANYYAANGIKSRTNLGTMNLSDVPIVLVECGNMKNKSDAARMTSSTGRARYADGIVAGIRRFLGE
jgi:N-acetylmuramoyl-L-alanine amidase